MPDEIWHGRRIACGGEIFNSTMSGRHKTCILRIVPAVQSLRVRSKQFRTTGNKRKTRNLMAKLRRKHGQTVLLLDDSPASSSALKKNMNNTQSTKKEILTSESITRLEKLIAVSPNVDSPLNVALIYEDAPTREWAREAFECVTKVAAEHGVRPTWWNLDNLGNPGVLAAAVSTAMRADVIVLAARAGDGMPLAFYAWINAWLPNRFHSGGVLA